MAETRKKARIVETRALTPSVCSLRFALDAGPLTFAAGQWIDLYVRSPDGVQKRAYSIASDPRDELVELAITRVDGGVVSPALHALRAGDAIEIDGPHGFFTRDRESASAPALFVATGTGLSPLRSMLGDWRRDPARAPLTLLFGCRTEHDILWRDELEALARDDERFQLAVTLSRPTAAGPHLRGYVQQHVPELSRALGAPHVFICGLNRMVSEVRGLCKSVLGYDRKRVHSERYD